jgi:hypothetical protein
MLRVRSAVQSPDNYAQLRGPPSNFSDDVLASAPIIDHERRSVMIELLIWLAKAIVVKLIADGLVAGFRSFLRRLAAVEKRGELIVATCQHILRQLELWHLGHHDLQG